MIGTFVRIDYDAYKQWYHAPERGRNAVMFFKPENIYRVDSQFICKGESYTSVHECDPVTHEETGAGGFILDRFIIHDTDDNG